MSFCSLLRATAAVLCLGASGCGQSLDAGSTHPHGLLPVDERNPIVLMNDGWSDNWAGEYAVLLANGGGPKLAAIIVNTAGEWTDIDANLSGWQELVKHARDSGMTGIPDPRVSISKLLVRPASGMIEDTVPNRSDGAFDILQYATELSVPYRPLVVVTGTRLTDVADAYLVDPTIADRIVVVSSLGTTSSTGAIMSNPNGEMDPWADTIVSERLRYVQVSAYYDQLTEVPVSLIPELPSNTFGAWIESKQAGIYDIHVAADQVGVLAAGFTPFVTAVERVAASGTVAAGATAGPDLTASPDGPAWLVTESASALAVGRFWELLRDPKTFSH
jgi:hypothetical protein